MSTETEYVAPEEIEQSKDYKIIENAIFGDQSQNNTDQSEQSKATPPPKKRGRKLGSSGSPKASLVLRLPVELEALYSSKEGRQLATAILELYSLPSAQKRIAALLARGLSPQDCDKGLLSDFAKVELETTIAELEEEKGSPVNDCENQTNDPETTEVSNV